jgi:16S rRNA (guanine527-N7)-methyltransferase
LPRAERYAEWLTGAGVERGLVGPRESPRIWERHLLNCAAVEPLLPPTGSICDLGSGAGLPGVVLALLRPGQPLVLLEPLLRRAAFLEEVVDDLELDHVTVVRARAEDYARSAPDHDAVVARAVAPLTRLLGWAFPLLRPGGELLALKGERADAELAEARTTLKRLRAVEVSRCTLGKGDNLTTIIRAARPEGS